MKCFRWSRLILAFGALIMLAGAIAMLMSGNIMYSHAALSSSQSSWSLVPSPNVGTNDNKLDNMAAIAANNIWAVGRYSTGPAQPDQPLVEQWNGTSWSVAATPSISVTGWLSGIAVVPGASELWAVGAYSGGGQALTLIEHYNGSSWAIVSSPNIPGNDYLYQVVAISASNVWAVGNYTDASGVDHTFIEHYDGNSWSIVSSPDVSGYSNELRGITAVSASDLWVTGDYHNTSGTILNQTLIEHYDGSTWTIISSPNASGSASDSLIGTVATSANDVWAVGNYSNGTVGSGGPLIEHYDGNSWAIVSSPGAMGGSLHEVATLSGSDVWAVGTYYNTGGSGSVNQTLTEHWDGTSWSVVSSPNSGSTNNFLNGGVAVSSNDVWAVGFYQNTSGVNQTLIEHYAPVALPTPSPTTPTVSPTPTQPPVHPIQQHSLSWAGYVVGGKSYRTVVATWTLPTITCSANQNAGTSQWVGYGGYGGYDHNPHLEQTGIQEVCNKGTLYVKLFYENYNATTKQGVAQPFPNDIIPQAGDTITASETTDGKGNFTSQVVVNKGQPNEWKSTVVPTKVANAKPTTAEVIAEAMPVNNTNPWPHFGSVTFYNCSINGQTFVIGSKVFQVTLVDTHNAPRAGTTALAGNAQFSVIQM